MPYNRDGIDKLHSYSLTDIHDFEECPFRFYVRHHLGRKYDLDEGNPGIALGNLLDQTIKLFHDSQAYGKSVEYLPNLVKGAERRIREYESSRPQPNFYSTTVPYLTPEIVEEATKIFQRYYQSVNGKIKPSLGKVDFLQLPIQVGDKMCKIWGGPDTFEMGEDGVPEVVDYKSRQNIHRGKQFMDMELMPKVYMLLASEPLRKKGFKQARFIVRFWQDPLDESFYQDFDLNVMTGEEFLLKQKLERILKSDSVDFCQGQYCSACNHGNRRDFIEELKKLGLKVVI